MKDFVIAALVFVLVIMIAAVCTAAPKDAPQVCAPFVEEAGEQAVGQYKTGWAYGLRQATEGVMAPPMEVPYFWGVGYADGYTHGLDDH